MKKYNVNFHHIIASLIACLFLMQPVKADRIVAYYFEPFPGDQEHAEQLSGKLQKPGKVAKCLLQGYACYSPVAGIISSYAGYINASDVNGFTSFPKKQIDPSFTLVVTPVVTPVFMFSNTIHNWKIEQPNPVATYKIERKKDEQTDLIYWEVTQIANPENNIIPLEAILIVANPKNIVIPEGITLSSASPNLLLPNMYVKKGIRTTQHAIYMLNLNYLFGPVRTISKKTPKRIGTIIY